MNTKPNENRYTFVHPIEFNYEPLCSIGNPNWKNPEHYKVSPEHEPHFFLYLAWEALRRNRYFQKFCDDYISSNLQDWDVPPASLDQWGLTEFKHYKECFISEISPKPLWLLPNPIRLIPNLYKDSSPKTKIEKSTDKKQFADGRRGLVLEPGEVAVVFDLKGVAQFRSLLTLQLKAAQVQLNALLPQLRMDLGVLVPEAGVQKDSIIPSLRLADAMLSNPRPSRVDLAKVLFPEIIEGALKRDGGAREIQGMMNKKIKGAAHLIYERGYLALLAKDVGSSSGQDSKKNVAR